MTHSIENGVPHINGKPAIHEPIESNDPFVDSLSDYKCPECGARLSKKYKICLNACHLSPSAYGRMTETLRDMLTKRSGS